jgi:hypothetical protein
MGTFSYVLIKYKYLKMNGEPSPIYVLNFKHTDGNSQHKKQIYCKLWREWIAIIMGRGMKHACSYKVYLSWSIPHQS